MGGYRRGVIRMGAIRMGASGGVRRFKGGAKKGSKEG